MKWTTASLMLTVTMCLLSLAARGDDLLGLYVGAGLGESEIVRDRNDALYFNEHHFAWDAVAGIRPISPVGVELDYIDFGDPHAGPNFNYRSANSEAMAAALFGLGYLPMPVPFLDVYGKLGIARLHSKTSESLPGICPPYAFCPVITPFVYQQNQWTTDLAYGAGVQAKMSTLSVRAEYERISASGGDPRILSLGVTWTF